MARQPQSTAELLRALERSGLMKSMDPTGRMDLLAAKFGAGGLLGGGRPERASPDISQGGLDAIPNGLMGGRADDPMASASIAGAPGNVNAGQGLAPAPLPMTEGLLGLGRKRRGLLSGPDPIRPSAPPPTTQQAPPSFSPPARRGGFDLGAVGGFLDDAIFGGAASERAAERRQRGEQEAMQAAHRDAFAYATQGGAGFNPTAYETRMAELGQAPSYDALAGLEGISDSQDVRGQRGRAERRGVQAGAVAPLYGMNDEQFGQAAPGTMKYLMGEGYGLDEPLTPPSVGPMLGAGLGADGFLDNQRGDQSLAEQARSNRAGEGLNAQQLSYKQQFDAEERNYRTSRDQTEDQYRRDELDLRRELGAVPNSTGDVIAPILSKVATGGVEALSDGERAIWENYQRQSQGQGGLAALFGGAPQMAPSGGATGPAPAAGGSQQSPARPASQADFDRLPAGAWFINPADGQVMQKAR